VLVVITAGLLSCLPCLMVKAIVERAETSRASQRDGEKRAAVHEPTWTLDCSLPPPLAWGPWGTKAIHFWPGHVPPRRGDGLARWTTACFLHCAVKGRVALARRVALAAAAPARAAATANTS
jgi:hypothetical protein